MAKTLSLLAVERIAEDLGENFDWLIDIAIEREPEDGGLTVYGPGEQWFYAFTQDNIENAKELIRNHRTRG